MTALPTTIPLLRRLLAPGSEFLVIASDWTIVQMSSDASRFADVPGAVQIGRDIRVGFPELVGLETILDLSSYPPRFELKGIERSTVETPLFFDLGMIHCSEDAYLRDKWLAILTDTTEAMRLEQSLAQGANEANLLLGQLSASKAYIDQIIASMPDALIVTTANHTIKTINLETQRLLGYTETELIGQPIQIILKMLRDVNIAEVVSQSAREIETTCRTKMGQTVEIAFSSARIKTSIEDFDSFVYSLRDITERKQAETAKRSFFAMISHEIRTPMNAIVGLTNVLLNTILSHQQRDLLQTIRTSGDALLTIINDILDFSKIESGKLELEQHPFSVQDCVQSAIDLLSHRATEKGLTVRFESQAIPAIVGDQTRLRQILVNLIGNALKFTDRGEIAVAVHCDRLGDRLDDSSSVKLEFAIRDTGIGISLQEQDRLFQSFSQVNRSISAQYGGTGLGLAISKQLCELMNGRIWVESQVGRGSTFYFTIVAPVAEVSAVFASATTQASVGFALQYPLQILVAEDNPINQKVIRLMLEQLGYQADLVENGLEAVEAVQHQSYDVVLMDVQMPQVDGLMATEQIRQAQPLSQCPRIIAMTAFASSEDRSRCFAAGMDDYVTKPIRLDQLMRSLIAVQPISTKHDTAPQPSELETIHLAALVAVQSLANGSSEFVVEMIDCYLEDAPNRVRAMRHSFAQQDLKSLKRAAHTLTSMSEMLGAIRLAQLCAKLEATSLQEGADIATQIEQIKVEYDRAQAALQQERQRFCN